MSNSFTKIFFNVHRLLLILLSFSVFSLATRFVVHFPWPRSIIQFCIRIIFIKGYGVDAEEAEKPIEAYPTIVSFFIRKLKPGVRKIQPHPKTLISPVDGRVMDWGSIGKDNTYKVKGKNYVLSDLIGQERIESYQGGNYLILYLSPKEYHRIHHLQKTNIQKIEYFPGRLLPVNLYSLTHFDNVFGRNKRLLIEYKDPSADRNSFIMVLVGALNVGKITVSDFPHFYRDMQKSKFLNPSRYELNAHKSVNRGDEAGIFHLGSTVVLLFKKNTTKLNLKNDQMLQMGQSLGQWS